MSVSEELSIDMAGQRLRQPNRQAARGVNHKISGSRFELSASVRRPLAFIVCVPSYKEDSPSSGLFRVKVYNKHGMAQRNGMGTFAREVINGFPLLPLEE